MFMLAASAAASSAAAIKTSLAPSKLWIGVLGAVYSNADQDITYQIICGSVGYPAAGSVKFPIPAGTTYVRHTPAIPLSGQSGLNADGAYTPPGAPDGGANGVVGWGQSLDQNQATTAFVTVHIIPGTTGTIVCDGVIAAGDNAGVVPALAGRTTIFQPGEKPDSQMKRLALDTLPSIDMGFSPGAAPKFVPIMRAIVGESTWACFGGTDAFVVAANNAIIIPLGANQIVAVGGANIVAGGGGNIIQGLSGAQIVAGGGGNIVAGGGGNIVAGGGGNIFSGATNIVAAGGGNIVAAGGGNAVSVDIGGRGMMKVSDIYKDIASIVAGGSGNIVAGGGLNLIAVKGDVVSNDGAGLVGLDGASLIGLDGASLGTFSFNALTGGLSMIPPTLVQAVVQLNKNPAALIGDGGGTFKAGVIASLRGGYVLNTAAISAVPVTSLIGDGGGTLIGDGGGTLIGDGGGTLIGAGGSTLIGAGGSTLVGAGGSTAIGASVSNLAPGTGVAAFSSGMK
jgi:hypothetical protein